MEIDPYEKQQLDIALRVLQSSPHLCKTQKVIIERLFEQIEEIYKTEEYI